MSNSTMLFVMVAVLLAVVVAAIAYFAGQVSVRGSAPVVADQTQTTATVPSPMREPDQVAPTDPRADLLRALRKPAAERERAIRVAMNAWLTTDGAAAVGAVRDDPELGEVANRMTQLALFAYPQIFVDDPSLLEGIPDSKQSIAMAARAIAMFDPDAARGMIDAHLSDSIYRDMVLSAVDQVERLKQDPQAELESIVAGTGMESQHRRLRRLVNRLAADDPVATAELVDDLPAPLKDYATQALAQVWSGTDPEAAARWLAEQNVQVSGDDLKRLARSWGQSDFEAANAFADTLTGRKRAFFLTGLADATPQRWSEEELLAWVSRYEGEYAYPDLMVGVVRGFAQEDVGAAIELIETLPERIQLDSYRSVLRSLAPEAAITLIDEVGNESWRDALLSTVFSAWARTDMKSALDRARDLSPVGTRDLTIASVSFSLIDYHPDLDIDHVIEVLDEIEDPELRKASMWPLLFTVESDDEAMSLGRDFGLDRNAVLEVREQRDSVHGPGPFMPFPRSVSFGSVSDMEEEVE